MQLAAVVFSSHVDVVGSVLVVAVVVVVVSICTIEAITIGLNNNIGAIVIHAIRKATIIMASIMIDLA